MNEVAQAEWDALLERLGLGDPYFLRAYVESACEIEPGEPALLHLPSGGGEVCLPCIVRDVPGFDLRDVITPYGYGGPVGAGDDPPYERFWAEYEEWCRERGVVATFVRFHPLFGNHRHAGPGLHAEHAGTTVGWPLDGDLLAGMHGKHRNTVRKAMKAGVAVEATVGPDDLGRFASLYRKTMHRQQASAYYLFADAYWQRLLALGDRLVRFDASHEGEVVASALCLRGPRWLHYHLGATADAARDLGASNLLLYEAALWAQEAELETFHLGGGAGGRDSLLAFKQRFSPGGGREFWVGKAVHDEHAYRRLCGGRDVDYEGFFPAYRAP